MLTGNTITKLQEMHMTMMAKALREQLSDPEMNSLSFEDRIGLIVDREWTSRKNNHLKCICRSQNRSCTDLKPHFNGYKTAPLPLVNRTKE